MTARNPLDLRLTMPCDEEAERAFVGCILADSKKLWRVAITEEHFWTGKLRKVYRAIRALEERSELVDAVTVAAELDATGNHGDIKSHELFDIWEQAGAAPEPFFRILERERQRRALLQTAHKLAQIAREPSQLDPAAHGLEVIDAMAASLSASAASDIVDLRELAIARADELMAGKGFADCVPTGIRGLDDIIIGAPRGEALLLAGRTSMGKTACGFQITGNIARRGENVMFCSAEMGRKPLADRALAAAARVDLRALRAGKLSESEWRDVALAACEMPRVHIFDRASMSPEVIMAEARRIHAKTPLAAIVVDYLQFLARDREDDVAFLAYALRALRNLAKALNCALIVLSQLSRKSESGEKPRRPRKSDLRGSGTIEEDADIIVFVHRPEVYDEEDMPGMAELIIDKNRNGPTGIETVRFDKRTASFFDLK